MHFIDAQIQKWNFNYVRQSFIFCCYLRIAKFERESVHLGECISRDPECIFRGDRPDRFWTRVTENNELIIPMWITTASIQHTPCDVIVFYVHTSLNAWRFGGLTFTGKTKTERGARGSIVRLTVLIER